MWLFVASFVFMAVFYSTAYAVPDPISLNTPSISINSNTVTALVDVGDFNTLKTGNTIISVTTTNPTGYTMTLTTSGASTNLVSGTNTIPTLSSNSSVSSFPVGRWGYSLDNTTYRPAPSVSGSGDTLATTSEANSAANTYTLYIGAKVANTQPSGTYTNTLVITAVANPLTYSISYNANGGSPTPEIQTFVSNDYSHTFTIPSTTPSKSGYTFKGWCDGAITGNNGTDAPTCSSNTYATSTSIHLLYNSPVATLNAMWQRNTATIKLGTATNISSVFYGTSSSDINTELTTTGFTATSNTTYYFRAVAADGYTFSAWSGWITGSNATYSAGKSFTNNGSTYTINAAATANTYHINYYVGNGAETAGANLLGTSDCTFGESCTLTTWANLGGTLPGTGFSIYGWVTSPTKTTGRDYSNGATITTYSTVGDTNLYVIARRPYYFSSGVEPLGRIATVYQYWNPYSLSQLRPITIPTQTDIEGWTFIGYKNNNTASSSVTFGASTVGTSQTPSATLSSATMRSVYQRTVSVNYNANGGTGTINASSTTQYYNSGYGNSGGTANNGANVSTPSITLPSGGFNNTGHSLTNWALGSASGTQYNTGASYSFTNDVTDSDNVTMYAIWQADTHTITFKSYDGNTTYGTQDFVYGTATNIRAYNASTGWNTKPTAPSGKSFYGWAASANSTTRKYTNAQSISNLTSDTTVYAIWRKAAVTYTATTQRNVSSATGTDTTAQCTISAAYNGASQATSCDIDVPSNPYTLTAWTFRGWVNAGTSTTTTNTSGTTSGKMTISGNVNIVATWRKSVTVNASVTFYANGGNSNRSASGSTTVSLYNGNTTLSATNVSVTAPTCTTYSGYECIGYNTSSTATTSSWNVGASKSLSVSGTVPIAQNSFTKSFSYYHIWQSSTPTMQSFTTALCNSKTIGSTFTLRDARDGRDYDITRLADGYCWMTDNLIIGYDGPKTLTSADTDMTSGTFNLPQQLSNYANWTQTNSAAQLAWNSIYGMYYNYYAASAGTLASAMSTAVYDSSMDAYAFSFTSSICPKKWKIPTLASTGNSSYDYDRLLMAYGWNGVMDYGYSMTPFTQAPLYYGAWGFMSEGSFININEDIILISRNGYLNSNFNNDPYFWIWTGNAQYSGTSSLSGADGGILRCVFKG